MTFRTLDPDQPDMTLPKPDQQQLLEEVRKVTGVDWRVVSYTSRGKHRKNPFVTDYVVSTRWELLMFVGGRMPWKIMIHGHDPILSKENNIDIVVGYLQGVLLGAALPNSKTGSL